MTQSIREVMTKDPVTLPADRSVLDAARCMRDSDIGDVIIVQGDRVAGILTDRDIVVRAVAEGRDPAQTKVAEVATMDPATVAPDDSIDDAIRIMRERNIRRLPVVENGRPVGVVTIGDLAMERDRNSALADISAAPPNN
jgi:CBS domain-containing protein